MSSGQHGHHHPHEHRAEAAHPARPPATSGHRAPVAHGEHAGHDKHAGHSVEMFRQKFWVSLALTIPTLLWGHMLARLVGRHEPLLPGGQITSRASAARSS